jgi:hypothetical protein
MDKIQYVGFSASESCRVYTFYVIDESKKAREFLVEVPDEAFRSFPLKFQDCPGLCFAILKRELNEESQVRGLRARTNVYVGEQDIKEYLRRQYRSKRQRSGLRHRTGS